VKVPETGKIMSVLLPGSWSPESKLRFQIGVVQQVAIVIDDLHGLAALDS
jgi:hypothetical protein